VLVFTLTVRNQGSAEAMEVVLRETVPADSAFEAASSSAGWSCSPDGSAGSACTLPIGSVGTGGSASFDFAVRLRADLPPGTVVSNTACVEPAPGAADPPENNCPTLVVDPPGPESQTDIEVEIAADDPLLKPGASFLFTLTVRNASRVPAEGLRLSVALPGFGTEPTELDPACQSPEGVVIECALPQLAGGATVQFTWKQAAFQVGDYTVLAELMAATPEDVDSTPGNGVRTEDDYDEVTVSASTSTTVHDIPTLSAAGISVMVLLLVALGVFVLRRGTLKSRGTAT
jgi:uncharacterized repeat protein (TIGR01451 family)